MTLAEKFRKNSAPNLDGLYGQEFYDRIVEECSEISNRHGSVYVSDWMFDCAFTRGDNGIGRSSAVSPTDVLLQVTVMKLEREGLIVSFYKWEITAVDRPHPQYDPRKHVRMTVRW